MTNEEKKQIGLQYLALFAYEVVNPRINSRTLEDLWDYTLLTNAEKKNIIRTYYIDNLIAEKQAILDNQASESAQLQAEIEKLNEY